MGFISKIFNPGGRTTRLEKLQNELSEFYSRYQGLSSAEISDRYLEDTFKGLADAMSGKGPSEQAAKAKDHRYEAARLEYLDLCLQNETISMLVESNQDSPEDLWDITQEMAAEGLCGKVGSKWMHLEVIADEIALFAYYGAKIKQVSNLEISQLLTGYFKGRINPEELLAFISNKPDVEDTHTSHEGNDGASFVTDQNTHSDVDPEDGLWECVWESVDKMSDVIFESFYSVNQDIERTPKHLFNISAAALVGHIFPIVFPEGDERTRLIGVYTELVRDIYITDCDLTQEEIASATMNYIGLLTKTGEHIKSALTSGDNPLHHYQKAVNFIYYNLTGEIEGSTPPMTVATISIAEGYQECLQDLVPHIENMTGVEIGMA